MQLAPAAGPTAGSAEERRAAGLLKKQQAAELRRAEAARKKEAKAARQAVDVAKRQQQVHKRPLPLFFLYARCQRQ